MVAEEKKKIKKRGQLDNVWRQLKKNKLAMLGLIVFSLLVVIAIACPMFIDYDKTVILQNNAIRLQSPNGAHLFGTDQYGRDVLARVIWGSRVSLFVGIFTVSIALTVGGSVGAIAGYFGGQVDNILMRIMDVFLAMPGTILAVAIVGALGPGMFNILLALAMCRIPQFARIVRSSVITIRGLDYIEAAKACGTSTTRILWRHVIPNAIGPIVVQCTLHMATTILGVAGLSFIGLGIQPPTPEWGSMLSEAKQQMRYNPYLMMFPGIAIMISVLSLNMIGDGLRDALDPRLKN
jgi:peptide/nickel transport system permease protein